MAGGGGRDELVRYFTLTAEDLEWINNSARGTSAKLGLAVQLRALPWLGCARGRRGRAGCGGVPAGRAERALEHDVPSVLFRLATERLSSDEVRMIRPGVMALMREIASARTEADRHLYRLVGPILTANPALPDELDGLLVVPEEMSVIPESRRRQMAAVGRRLRAQALQRGLGNNGTKSGGSAECGIIDAGRRCVSRMGLPVMR